MNGRPVNEVDVGTWVKIAGFVPGQEEVFELVPHDEADYDENKIPPSSPLARVLVGAKVGDSVQFSPPAGTVELRILDAGQREQG
jgi:transcription elongation GreA/GreB family factor